MISACIITTNEEYRIAKVINNIKDYVDEIVIVDGGSRDKTVEIARNLGAKVFYRKWDNDFGAQRNFSIRKAKGDWIFIIDADETASKGLLRALKDLTKTKEAEGFGFTRKNYINNRLDQIESSKINLFKRHARYKEKIHEQPRGLKRILIIFDKNIYLNHYKTDNDQIRHLVHYYKIIENNLKSGINESQKKKYEKLLEITRKDLKNLMRKYNSNKELLPADFKIKL